MIHRVVKQQISKKLHKGKAIILTGPRQVGKTTMLMEIAEAYGDFLFLNGDDPTVRTLMNNPSTELLKSVIGDHTLIFIDEAQRIDNIGLTLKLITDRFKKVQLLVSGSSAFELQDLANEPLTGRKLDYRLFPVSWEELEGNTGVLKARQQLEQRLLYGFYPDIINNPGDEQMLLRELTDSYLYKDMLSFGGIKKPEILERLLQALAFQLGNEVSYNELASLLQVDKNTVAAYIDILEKGYVVFRLNSFSRNLRNEIKTNRKIYFWDNGIRNAVIGNFNPLDLRSDKGALWENFLLSERMKINAYHHPYAKSYFWRTKQQQEIDYVEEHAGALSAYEFKWQAKGNTKIPLTFTQAYEAKTQVIDISSFRKFVLPK